MGAQLEGIKLQTWTSWQKYCASIAAEPICASSSAAAWHSHVGL